MTPNTGGLGELPAAVGPSDQQQEQINDRWNTYALVEQSLGHMHIHPPKPPMFGIPEVTPEILRGLNDDQYMEVYNAHDAWNSFIGETVSQLENIILQIENEMDDLNIHVEQNMRETARVGGEGKKPPAEEVKFAIKSHPRIRYLKLELQKQQQMLGRLVAKQKTLSRAEKLLSRNIELIKSARESMGGSSGIPRRASGLQPPQGGYTGGLPPRMGP